MLAALRRRLYPDEDLIPFVMFAGGGWPAAGEGLVENLETANLVNFHPAPIGKATAALAGDLISQ